MTAAQANENHGDERDLTWYFLWGIYTSVPTWTHSQNSLAVVEAPSLKTWPRMISQMITKTIPISTQIVIIYEMKWGNLLWIWWKVNENWDINMIRISQWTKRHCRTNTSVRRNKSKRAGLRESQSGIPLGKLTIWVRVRSFEITRLISSTRIGKPVLMMDAKVSKDKNISWWVDQENLIYVRWNRIKNRAQSWRRWSIEEKEVRQWVK